MKPTTSYCLYTQLAEGLVRYSELRTSNRTPYGRNLGMTGSTRAEGSLSLIRLVTIDAQGLQDFESTDMLPTSLSSTSQMFAQGNHLPPSFILRLSIDRLPPSSILQHGRSQPCLRRPTQPSKTVSRSSTIQQPSVVPEDQLQTMEKDELVALVLKL